MKSLVRIVVVDAHATVRKAVRRLLEEEPGLMVCAEAGTSEQLERALRRQHPDLVILDPALQEDGLTLIRVLRARFPALLILVLSLDKESLFAEATLRAGAQGYLMKNDAPLHLVHAIQEVARGQIYVSEPIQQSIYAKMRRDAIRRGSATISHTPPHRHRTPNPLTYPASSLH